MNISHLKITHALLLAAATQIITIVVAVIPAWAPEKQLLITIAGTTLTLAGLVANGLHKLGDSNVSTQDIVAAALNAARSEVSKVDFDGLVKDAVNAKSLGDVEGLVDAKVKDALSNVEVKLGAVTPPPVPPPPGNATLTPPPNVTGA